MPDPLPITKPPPAQTDQPSPKQLPPPPTTVVPELEIQSRIVNGMLVIVVVAIVGLLYALQSKGSAAYGAFTTLVGTALSAYFGISATREVSRNVVDNASHQVADKAQQLGQLQQRHDNVTAKLDAARNIVAPNPPNASDSTLNQLRSVLFS